MPILPFETDNSSTGSSSALSRLPDVVRSTTPAQSGGPSMLGTLARGIVAPLTAIDTPRRAIISGIAELRDALDDDPDTKASFGDFLEQTKDPTYGVGSAFPDPTGNKWLDRAIGFVGDVALDPITYATMGYGKIATLGSRAAYATNLLRAAKAVDRVDEVRPLVQKLTQRGAGALKGADRQLYDEVIRMGRIGTGGAGSEIGQAGIRLGVPFTKIESAPIPGTERLAEGLGGALSQARLRAGQSNVGQRVRRAVTPRERADLYEQMVMGGDPDLLIKRLFDVAAGDAAGAARNIAGRRLGMIVDEVASSGRKEGLSGEELTRQLSSGSVNATDDTVAGRARGFLDDGRQELADAGSTIEYRENYVPRVFTEEYDRVRAGDLGDEINQTLGIVDELGQEGITKTRQVNKGDDLVRGDVSVTLKGDDPFSFNNAMNELYPELGGSVKFVEEDGYKLLERWARSASAELGRLKYTDEIVRSGIGAPRSQVTRAAGITEDIAEETVAGVPQRVDDLRTSRTQAFDEARVGTSEARRAETARIQSEAAKAEGSAAQAQQRANAAYRRAEQQLRKIDDEVVKIDKQIDRLRGKQTNVAKRQLRDRSNRRSRLLAEKARIEQRLPELRASSEAAETLVRQSDAATATGVRPPGVTRETGAAIRATGRAEGRLADIGEELSALPRGGEGIVPDQQIVDEIDYMTARRGQAQAASEAARGSDLRVPVDSGPYELVPMDRLQRLRSKAPNTNLTEVDNAATVISRTGEVEPIVIAYSPRTNKAVIIEGHDTLDAIDRLGYFNAPTKVVRKDNLGRLDPYARRVPGFGKRGAPQEMVPSQIGLQTDAAAADAVVPSEIATIQARGADLEQKAADKLGDAAALRARDPQALEANARTAAAVKRRKKAQAAESRARRLVNNAAKDGFAPSLDGENAAADIAANLKRVPEQGNKRLRREARALIEDVPEGELLTRDQRYLAGLRQAAKDPNDVAAQVAFANMLQVYSVETKIAAEGGKGRTFSNFFEVLYGGSKNSADFRQSIMDELEDGWRMIEGTGVAVPEEVRKMRLRIAELNKPETFNGFLKAWETYTKYFKAYVTATPRFHVRNGMSASFMNWSEGVSAAQMIEGVRVWKKYASGGLDALDGRERVIIESVLGSGAGQYDMIEVGLRAPLGTRTSRKVGTNVEGGVRTGLAVKVVDGGGSFEEALAAITRVHFNYSQYSNVDRVARQIFPFWTFMSRNLPLQVTQMWSKPRAYARFNTLIRNIRTDDEETGIVPDYFTEGGGFRLPFNIPGVGQWARPDLGFSRVEEDVERLKDPVRFLADSNPLIKAAVENFAGKQLYKDIPLDDESYVPLEGWQQLLAPVLAATGNLETGPGGYVITPKTEYLLDQINPVGGLINRYSGEGSRNEDNALKNILGASGIPALLSLGGYVRDLTPEVQQSAAKRKQYEQRDALRKLQEIARAS